VPYDLVCFAKSFAKIGVAIWQENTDGQNIPSNGVLRMKPLGMGQGRGDVS